MDPSLSPEIMTAASDLGFAALLLILLHITRPAYLAFRRRRAGFGIVFDSVSGLPVDRAAVSLRDLHGQVVRTVVTEKDGRYRLLAPKGEYTVEVVKAGFTFPSVHFKGKSENAIYGNLLPGDHILIKDHGAITKNIAIDKLDTAREHSPLNKRITLSKDMQFAIAWLSPFLALGIAYVQPHAWVIWSMYGIYMLMMLDRLFSFAPPQPPFGTVRDAATGEPLANAVVRILDSRFNKLLETQVTSPKGRYAFIVNRGAYRIYVRKRGYTGVILNFPAVKEDRTLMAKDVRLKKIGTQITPLSQTLKGTLAPLPEARTQEGYGDLA